MGSEFIGACFSTPASKNVADVEDEEEEVNRTYEKRWDFAEILFRRAIISQNYYISQKYYFCIRLAYFAKRK